MKDKPKEEVYAERFDASKQEREQLSKEAINSMKMKNLRKKKVANSSLLKKKICCREMR